MNNGIIVKLTPLKDLIEQCQNEERAGQFELVKRFAPMLMTVCRRYTRDDGMAEDVLQEAWIRIFRYIGRYQHTGSFEAWMKKVTVNCALQWIDKTYFKNEKNLEFTPESIEVPKIYAELNAEEIIKHIQVLPEGYRTIFNMNVIDGFSHKEIADALGISENTSRTQLLRARRSLQKALGAPHKKVSA